MAAAYYGLGATVAPLMVLSLAAAGLTPAAQAEEAFAGWQSMRVIALDSHPSRLEALSLGESTQATALLLDRRRSEVVALRYLPPSQRSPEGARRRPNDPPMVPEMSSDRLVLRGLPMAVIAADVPGVGRRALVLSGPSPRLHILRDDGRGPLVEERHITLLPGTLMEGVSLQLLGSGGQKRVLVACQQGIQQVPLAEGQRPQWLSPRERLALRGWWWADANGNGRQDLLDWVRLGDGENALRWRRLDGTSLGIPRAADLRDFRADSLVVIPRDQAPAQIVALPSRGSAELRSYAIEAGDEGPFGARHQALLPNRGLWCGMMIDGEPHLLVADSSEPRLHVWSSGDDGFRYRDSWPGLSRVRAAVAAGGRLLLWREGEGDLLSSQWEDGRLTFPQPWDVPEGSDDRAILALGRVGAKAWWLRRVGEDLQLWIWHDEQEQPHSVDYPGAGGKAQRGQWLGNDVIVVQDQFSPNGRLLRLDEDGGVVALTPPHLARIDLNQYRLLEVPGHPPRPARVADGVLQWLNAKGQPEDQVMLEENQSLSDLVIEADGSALALEQGGTRAHRLQPDEAGVLRLHESIDLPGGRGLRMDPVLGMILDAEQSLLRLEAGRPWITQVQQVIDYEPASMGDAEAGIHRIHRLDVTGNGRFEVLAMDDSQHRITVYDPAANFRALLSWQVFSDDSYPYGYPRGESRPEPRLLAAGDLNGDGRQDLLLVCHDRLLIYFASDEEGLQ